MEMDLQEYFKQAIEGETELFQKKLLVGMEVQISVGSIHFKATPITKACICWDFISLKLKEPDWLEVYMAISHNSNFNGIGNENSSKYCVFYSEKGEKVLYNEGVKIILPNKKEKE